jgi:hypothetical protein
MDSYDLQDTLVRIDYDAPNVQALTEQILNAKLLYRPRAPFTIVTAQQDNDAIRQAIRDLVTGLFPNCRAVYFVEGSTLQVANAKAATLRRIAATSFTDNNRRILSRIRVLNPGLELYIMTAARERQPFTN